VFPALLAGCLGIGTAYGQQAKPTDEDVDRAIRVCSVSTKSDKAVEGGLSILKRRILSGGGDFSQSEIPSVIGSGVQGDEAKVQIFDRIQKCIVNQIYGAKSRPTQASEIWSGSEDDECHHWTTTWQMARNGETYSGRVHCEPNLLVRPCGNPMAMESPDGPVTASFHGSEFEARLRRLMDGNMCNYFGTVFGAVVNGTYTCNRTGGPFKFSLEIILQ
jgi:hypothetical protein